MRGLLLTISLAAMPMAVMAQQPAVDAAALGWMAGEWVEEKDGRWTEESWNAPRGGVMLGTNRSGKGERATGFEFMRIASNADGTLSFFGSPGGKPPVAFRLAGLENQSAVFENPAHDYPVTIRYWREGALLNAEVAGRDGANPMRWSFRRK